MKRISSLNTLVGAIPGALPPLIGWVAARGNYNLEGCLLFATLWFWQMPHFLAIAWMYKDDYADGVFVMLTANDPEGRTTSRQALLYSLFLIPITLLPSLLAFNAPLYFLGAWCWGSPSLPSPCGSSCNAAAQLLATCSFSRLSIFRFFSASLLPRGNEQKTNSPQCHRDGATLAFCYFPLRAGSDTHESSRSGDGPVILF
jgi:heme O synthase-like polyprenyltransferase